MGTRKKFDLLSPNGQLKVSISLGNQLNYTLSGNNKELLINNRLALEINNVTLGKNPQLRLATRRKGEELIKPYNSLKFSTVKSEYNDLLLTFKGDYAVEFRAFDDGIAYRFILNKKGDVEIMNEAFMINFPESFALDLQQANGFKTAYEEPYTHLASIVAVHNNMDLFKTFHDWGVKGVKIDFMERSDQWMVNYYENVLKEAAIYQIFVDFHGSFKPAGLEYKYPNLISYEGVRGMEQMGGCYPDNSIYFPFMRNVVGPMDYIPGAMISMQPDQYSASRPNAASPRTRAYQLALFVVFESGLQMLAHNPTLYYLNADCTEFITSVPTTWDETKALAADAGQVAVVVKRKGNSWFIGGITNGKEKTRAAELTFDFLEQGKTYTMAYFEDGINAGRQVMDYRQKTITVKSGDTITIKMAQNGGFAAMLK